MADTTAAADTAAHNKVFKYSGNNVASIICGFVFLLWLLVIAAFCLFLFKSGGGEFEDASSGLIGLSVASGIWVAVFIFPFLYGFDSLVPGERGYLSILDYPLCLVGVGALWHLPLVMSLTKKDITAKQEGDTEKRKYLSKDGVEMFVQSSSTYEVEDPLLAELIGGVGVPAFVAAQRETALRSFIGGRDVLKKSEKEPPDVSDPTDTGGIKEDMTRGELLILRENLATFKGQFSTSARPEVINKMNEQLKPYGLVAIDVQFEQVLFSDKVESKLSRIVEEVLESVGIYRDVDTKIEAAGRLLDGLLKRIGVPADKLSAEQISAHLADILPLLYSAEGQASFNRISSSGGSRPLVVVGGTTTNQPAPPAT